MEHASLHTSVLVLGLAKRNWDIFVLVHVHDLSLHGHEEEDEKVHEQYWPEHGNIKDGKEGHDDTGSCPSRTRQPEFELGQSPCKRPVLFGVGGG